MEFEWDEAKSALNRSRRGFGFEIVYDFDWDDAVILEDQRREYGETRFRAFGHAGSRRVFNAFTMRGGHNAHHQRAAHA